MATRFTPPDVYASRYRPKTRDRTSHYPPHLRVEWQDRVIEHVANGRSVASFVRENADAPTVATILHWVKIDPAFAAEYHAALLCMADALVDQIIDIADSGIDPKRGKLMIQARQYVASALNPVRYGTKVDVTSQGQHIAQPIDPDATPLQRVRAIVDRARAIKAADTCTPPGGYLEHAKTDDTPGEGERRTWSILD